MPTSDTSPIDTPVIEVAPPQVAELRGMRLFLPRSPAVKEIDALVARAADAGINALAVRVYRRGTTLWHSDAAPSWRLPRVRRWLGGRDVLSELAGACRRHAVALCAWVDLLPAMDLSRERHSPLAKRQWAWRMRRFSGSPHPHGAESDLVYLCPARPEVRLFLGDVCSELAVRYPVDALWFEGLRYPVGAERPDTTFCFCPICRSRVKAELGLDLSALPLDLGSSAYRRWTAWREAQLQELLGALVARLREVRSGLVIMGGVPLGWTEDPAHRTGLMDWVQWIREGLLDLATPLPFGSPGALSVAERLALLRRELKAVAPHGRIAPLLSLTALSGEEAPLLSAARALPLSGHVWNAVPTLPTEEEWDEIRRVHGSAQALVPEIDPLDSMHAVINEVAQTGYGQFSDGQMEKMLEEFGHHHAAAARRELPVADSDRVVRNLDWLQRQLVFLRSRQILTRGL
jgi:hypothetical protein